MIGGGWRVLDADPGAGVALELLDDDAGLSNDSADSGSVAEEAEGNVAGGDGDGRRRGLGALGRSVWGIGHGAGVGHACRGID